MGKLFIGIILLAAVAIGWFILNPGDTFDYVATIDTEVAQLETELAELDAAVEAGTLSVAQATEAKVKIITRLDAINTSVANSEKATLTTAQKEQLTEGLNRLKTILITYQATLSAVDAVAVDSTVEARLNKGNGSSKRLSLVIADTIESVEETVQDSVQDYEADTSLDAQVDVVVEETEAEVVAEEEMDETADEESDETMDETATSTEEDVESEEMPTMDDPETEEMMVNDSSTTVEGEAEVEVTQ